MCLLKFIAIEFSFDEYPDVMFLEKAITRYKVDS